MYGFVSVNGVAERRSLAQIDGGYFYTVKLPINVL